MITLPSFRLHRPRTLAEALRLLGELGPEAKAIAGGTDLVVNLRQRLFTPPHLVALRGVRELAAIESGPAGLRVGATARIADVAAHAEIRARYRGLAEAAASVASPTLRNMGTVGGNLCLETRCSWYNQSYFWRRACGFCLKKDGDFCHVAPGSSLCWAAYSGDLAPALLVLGAELEIEGARGSRRLPLRDFFFEDGKRSFDLAPGELILAVRVPAPPAGARGSYRKYRARGSIDFPLAAVAAASRVEDGVLRDAAVALTAVGPCPFLVAGVAPVLDGRPLRDEAALEATAALVRRAANPLRTATAAAPAYRRHRLGHLVREAIRGLGDSS
jgi:4-hydroxybenzoyl-CoA reductase subunit beta